MRPPYPLRWPPRLAWLSCLILAQPVVAEERPLRLPLENARLAPALEAAAKRDGIQLDQRAQPGGEPRVGDAVLLWVAAEDGDDAQQWLVEVERAAATADEHTRWREESVTKYLSWGPVLEFRSDAEALQIWIAGPVTVGENNPAAPAKAQRVRLVVPGEFLRLGLHHAALVDLHLQRRMAAAHEAGESLPLDALYSLDQPVDAASVARSRPVAERFGLTETMSRAWIGGYVGLQAFYQAAEDVRPLRAIVHRAVRRPPIWKLPRALFGTPFRAAVGGGRSRIVDPGKLGLLVAPGEAYALPFEMWFAQDPMVAGEMVVAWPAPPLDVSAGILAMIAADPKDPRRRVHLAAVASRRGPPVTAETPAAVNHSHE